MTTKTYQGSCHCKAVRFEADIDFSTGSGKCNCSICTKTRNWSVLLKPEAFRLLEGESALSDYQFGTKAGHHLFCKHCGVRSFGRGYLEQIGGDYVSVQVGSLDDLNVDDVMTGPVRIADGKNNAWWNTPAETRHL